MKLVNEGTEEGGHVSGLVPDWAVHESWGALESPERVRAEIDVMLEALRGFWSLPPDVVMRKCSALSARCTEMGIHLHRLEVARQWRQLRTMEVQRVLDEVERQYRGASRMLEQYKLDLNMAK